MVKNLIGEVYNNCTVIQIDEKRTTETKRTHWLLKCNNCGEILSRREDSLKNIKCSCNHRQYSQDNQKRINEMLGRKFGKLTVLEFIPDKRAPDGSLLYKCQCECGNLCEKSGTNLRKGTKSCGCLIGKKHNRNIEDLTGKKFNKITILAMTDKRDQNRNIIYRCKCDCGREFEAAGSLIKNGYKKSCGCLQKENLKKYLENVDYSKNETGKQYGNLTVLYRNGSTSGYKAVWHCKCSCGKELDVSGDELRRGRISCGCLKESTNIQKIKELLTQNNLHFIQEYAFDNCIDKRKLPFDIYVNNSYIIEYDGIQHFIPQQFYGEESFIRTHKHDLIKNKYCFDNNIPIIRIPFDSKFTISDLLLDTTKFLLTPENENQYYNIRKEKSLI